MRKARRATRAGTKTALPSHTHSHTHTYRQSRQFEQSGIVIILLDVRGSESAALTLTIQRRSQSSSLPLSLLPPSPSRASTMGQQQPTLIKIAFMFDRETHIKFTPYASGRCFDYVCIVYLPQSQLSGAAHWRGHLCVGGSGRGTRSCSSSCHAHAVRVVIILYLLPSLAALLCHWLRF